MATLVLTTVGTLVGGPIGGAIGGLVGNIIDGAIFAPKGGVGPRLSDLGVQLSGYGQVLPRLYGTVRAAGSVVWSSGLRETAHRSGGKRTGGRRTTYSYSSSFAVALSARPIRSIRRVWADGKLLRNSAGQLTVGGMMRVYPGSERQDADPLIAAHEGVDAPAYRGVGYVVFEDLQLAEFGNRLPNLTFEIDADGVDDVPLSQIADDLGRAIDVDLEAAGLQRRLTGFAAGRNAGVCDLLAQLHVFEAHDILGAGTKGLRLRKREDITPQPVPARDVGADMRDASPDTGGAFEIEQAARVDTREVVLSFFDPARDYQPGLQRAQTSAGHGAGRVQLEVSAVLSADQAKAIAGRHLLNLTRESRQASVRLPWRYAGLAPGDLLDIGDHGRWRILSVVIEEMTVVCRLSPHMAMRMTERISEPGRANLDRDQPFSTTVLRAFEAPPWSASLPATPCVWLAACGSGPGWRGAEYQISQDGGESWMGFAYAEAGAVIGRALTPLPAARADLWDQRSSMTVELENADMWLESRSASAVLGGANWAMLGHELIAFQHAELLAPRTYRLSGLLRGMRGSEGDIDGHAANDPFILLDPLALTQLELPLSAIGSTVAIRAVGPGDVEVLPTISHAVAGRALQPLSPVHVRAERLSDGAIRIAWVRRSRNGFAWIDGSDAPLAEESEQYQLRIVAANGILERQLNVNESVLTLAEQIAFAGQRLADFTIEIAQRSVGIGLGKYAVRHVVLP